MTTDTFIATNAASSGITLERKTLKALCRRSDLPGLIYLGKWALALGISGSAVYLALGTAWVWPAMLIYGSVLSVPVYAMSHETAHGTAFRTRWLNETVMWICALLYLEEPLHRRYTHTNHHTYTWHVGKDSQMPFDTPMTLAVWIMEISGFSLTRFRRRATGFPKVGLLLGRFCFRPEIEYGPESTRDAARPRHGGPLDR